MINISLVPVQRESHCTAERSAQCFNAVNSTVEMTCLRMHLVRSCKLERRDKKPKSISHEKNGFIYGKINTDR